jgi:tagaturonate epimerase
MTKLSIQGTSMMLTLSKFTFGVGDRFAHQARAQLRAFEMAAQRGIEIIPVWNKSYREHTTIGSEPPSVQAAAVAAVKAAGWNKPFHIDADHIRLETVDGFLATSDYFTIDEADSIGQPPTPGSVEAFLKRHPELIGQLTIAGIAEQLTATAEQVTAVSNKYLAAVQKAGVIYRHIAERKDNTPFATEVSMDETDAPQTPAELLVILAALADEKIPLQTIAPKFTGRFNKGVDYVGDVVQFEKEFADDLAVIAHAVKQYQLPQNLKLSVHSGSDKFSIYPAIRRQLQRTGAGLHIKTAGTTWLEEVIGLAEADGAGLALAKEIYAAALAKREALCAPYASVIDVNPERLPSASEVNSWTAERYVAALRHVPSDPRFNADFRQLLHVGYKVAAQLGERYLSLLKECETAVSRNVTENLWSRHILPLFG